MADEAAFEGGVFSATIEGGRAAARLSLGHDALLATAIEGSEFRLPYAECQLEVGGASGKMWFCRSPDRSLTLFTEAPGFAEALWRSARRELGPALARIQEERAERRKRSSLMWLGLSAVVLLLLLVGYLAIGHAGNAIVAIVPRSVDEKLGELALDNMSLGGPAIDDPVVQAGVREIVNRLAQAQPDRDFTYRVRVVDAPIENAFALPGGFIVVYTGLLRSVREPDQLAGVLAHEMAHVSERHGMRRIAQSVGVIATIQLMFGDLSGLAAIAVEILREGAINSYSRDQEREADRVGVKTLARARVDPVALAEFFALLEKKSASGLGGAAAWLGTHPELGERIATVRRLAAELDVDEEPFALDWEALQRRTGRSLPESTQKGP